MTASRTTSSDWYAPLRAVVAKGATTAKVTRLADLHARRQAHEGQFFTPEGLALYIGRLLQPTMDTAASARAATGGRVHVLDTSVGSGRLFAWCSPDRHALTGFDVDADAVAAVAAAAESAGFIHEIRVGRLEEMRPSGFDVAVLNPPFGLTFSSPLLDTFQSNSFGRFGPASSATSHVYALAQALRAASIVVAILPQTFAREIKVDPLWNQRLVAVLDLPASTFIEEGANVRTSLVVFDAFTTTQPCIAAAVADFAEAPPVLELHVARHISNPQLRSVRLNASEPTITLPVTGDRTVRIAHAGRRVVTKYLCGLTQARIQNAILRERLLPPEHHEERRPTGIEYKGQGALDLEIHLAQPDPIASWRAFVDGIRTAGGVPKVDPGIEGYLRRRHRRNLALRVPLQHTVKAGETLTGRDRATIKAPKTQLLDPMNWRTPIIKAGAELEAARLATGVFRITIGEHSIELDDRKLHERFEVIPDAATTRADGGDWQLLHPGRAKAFPQRAAQARARIEALGIPEWFGWRYQIDDLVELTTVPCSAIVAWDPALGKTRLAAALALVGSGRTLAVVEPHVLDQYADEIASLPLPAGFCKVIRSPADLEDTQARLLLISYNRLRLPLYPGAGRKTYARALRHRIQTLIADEGHRLGNIASAQSKAVRHVAARNKFALTGTPIQNLPRDTLWLASWIYGDGTVLQPYGIHHPYLNPALVRSTAHAERGIDRFFHSHVTWTWVTNEFKEDLTKGAKREIPVLKNETAFRAWIAPMLLRRVKAEPQVEPYFKQSAPRIRTITVPWDRPHLAAYVRTADEFAHWYRDARKVEAEGGKRLNLTVLLARIGAVCAAANHPHQPYKDAPSYSPVTSKQRAIVDRIDELVREGHTVLSFAVSPAVVTRLDRLLRERGHDPVMLHGKLAQNERTRAIRERVKTGQARVILATYGTSKTGLNLPQADRVILTCRGWTPLLEDQAIQRVMRCQQQREVEVEIFELSGSLDAYQAQMVEAKRSANASAIDSKAQDEGAEFLHFDTILGRFLTALAEREGFELGDWREQLKQEAA